MLLIEEIQFIQSYYYDFNLSEYFTPLLTSGFSLKPNWQHVSSDFQNPS